MSSTMRLYDNDKRVSTAVKVKSGGILQVFPTKQEFSTEDAWSKHWSDSLQVTLVRKDGEKEKPAPAPGKKLSWQARLRSKSLMDVMIAMPAPVNKKYTLDDWAIMKQENFKMTLAAGTYYIGDIILALNENVFNDIFVPTDSPGIYLEKSLKSTFLTSYSALGAGEFPCSDGSFFKIESGYFGIFNAGAGIYNPTLISYYLDSKYLRKFTFTEPVLCNFADGRFIFTSGTKSFLIDTTGDDDAY